MVAEGKQCHGECNEWKSLDQFGKQSNAPDGLRYICKDCQREYARQRYLADPSKIKAANANWVANNPERAKVNARRRAKKFRERYPERVREASRKYYERTKKGKAR